MSKKTFSHAIVKVFVAKEEILGARGYSIASSGNVTDEAWKEYIKNQKPDDDFSML
jgi:REP element-mobilizing transposase RayT